MVCFRLYPIFVTVFLSSILLSGCQTLPIPDAPLLEIPPHLKTVDLSESPFRLADSEEISSWYDDESSGARHLEESPGVGSYALYGLIGAPRDLLAIPLEIAGYGVGIVGGIALNILCVPAMAFYENEYKVARPVSRGCVMAPSFPFFITSDFFCRSFTGDTNRYRWGVHPFPRVDHRFFPNYHAILELSE